MSHIVGPRRHRRQTVKLRQNNGRQHGRQDSQNANQDQVASGVPTDTFNPNNNQPTSAVPADPAPVVTPTTTVAPSPNPVASTTQSSTTDLSPILQSIFSSSSSSASTTSTTSSTSSVISTTSTTTSTTPLPSFSAPTSTFIQTISTRPAASGASANPSPTRSSSPVSGATAGIITGGIIAAILGTAGVVFAVVYFLRKCRRNEDEALSEEIWNRPDALRQSTILPDDLDPPRSYNALGPGSPRPPTMIERHLNRAPTTPTHQPPPNMYSNDGYGAGYGYGATQYGQPSFSPGDVMSPTSANPFISPYAQDIMTSPVSSNVPDYHDLPSPPGPAVPPSAFTTQSSSGMGQAAVIRQNSVTGGSRSPMDTAPDATDPHYVDLSRSSVTPFQAAQYAEITEKLSTPMSSVMILAPVVSRDDASSNRTLVPHTDPAPQDQNAPTQSPFADPGTKHPDVYASDELDTEVPLPSPVLMEHTRVASSPPTLPEIQVPERSFSPVASLEFPVPLSARETPSPFSLEFSDARTPPPAGLKYKNSPLATSSPTRIEPTVIHREPKTEAEPSKRDTVYTLYEEEDAYGGI